MNGRGEKHISPLLPAPLPPLTLRMGQRAWRGAWPALRASGTGGPPIWPGGWGAGIIPPQEPERISGNTEQQRESRAEALDDKEGTPVRYVARPRSAPDLWTWVSYGQNWVLS